MKIEKLFIAFCLFVITFIVIIMKLPTENRNVQKFEELNNKISELEHLLKDSNDNFKTLQSSLNHLNVNEKNINKVKQVKSLLQILSTENKKTETNYKPIFKSADFYKLPIKSGHVNTQKLLEKLSFTDVDGGVWKQGFDIKPTGSEKKKLKVFIVPHSHQDPGWIKTFDQYFTEETKPILDSMLKFLHANPNMTFIYAEMSFFKSWFDTLSSDDIKKLKTIISRKQLEIVTGGWVMNDEANPHFYSIITQITEGHRWLKQKLNYRPKTGWAIDLFGHSQSMPYILQKAGIQNLVIQRVHYIIKKALAKSKLLEFQWSQYWDKNSQYVMPTHMMPFFSYDVPHTCGPDPRICCQFDFERTHRFSCPWKINPVLIDENNVKERSNLLLDQYLKKAELYKNGNNILIPLGDDFRYGSNDEWNVQFSNYMKIIKYINKNKRKVEIKFGTLSDYFDSVGEEQLSQMPTLTGDMFTYADREDKYWSGYYTSRPLIKVLDRLLNSALRTAEISQSLALLYQTKYKVQLPPKYNKVIFNELDIVRKALSISQHHDTITGTSKDFVTVNGGDRIVSALSKVQTIFATASQSILDNKNRLVQNDLFFDVEDIISTYGEVFIKNVIDFRTSSERLVYIFNSLTHPREVVVDLPIELESKYRIQVSNSGNLNLNCQIRPMETSNSKYLDKANSNNHTISFKLAISPLTYEQIKLVRVDKSKSDSACKPVSITSYKDTGFQFHDIYQANFKKSNNPTIIMKNNLNEVQINSQNGHVKSVQNILLDKISRSYDLDVHFKYYGVVQKEQTAGAYLFLPDGEGLVYESPVTELYHFSGEIFDEVMIVQSEITSYFRLYKVQGLLANIIDVRTVVDVTKKLDFELSMVVATDAVTPGNIFYTDSNCFQFVMRKTLNKLPLQANVYPSICGSFVENEGKKLTVLTRQPSGVRGGTINGKDKKGFIEYFLDRIINHDDNRGLFQQMTDNKIVEKRFRINLESWENHTNDHAKYLGSLTVSEQQLLNDLNSPVDKLFVKPNYNKDVNSDFSARKSLMTGIGLPCDYHMVVLRTDVGDESPNILLQRYALNPLSKYISYGSCRYTKKKFPLFKSLFDDLSVKSVQKSLITGLNVSSSEQSPESTFVGRMEVENYRLNFHF